MRQSIEFEFAKSSANSRLFVFIYRGLVHLRSAIATLTEIDGKPHRSRIIEYAYCSRAIQHLNYVTVQYRNLTVISTVEGSTGCTHCRGQHVSLTVSPCCTYVNAKLLLLLYVIKTWASAIYLWLIHVYDQIRRNSQVSQNAAFVAHCILHSHYFAAQGSKLAQTLALESIVLNKFNHVVRRNGCTRWCALLLYGSDASCRQARKEHRQGKFVEAPIW